MKFSSAAVLSSLAFLSDFALAQTVQSKPFHLTIVSDNKTYNGMGLSTCHEGAAIESLCVAKTSAVYHLNTTKSQTAPIKGDSVSGVLTWVLPSSPPESEPMAFFIDPTTNVALPLFEPSYEPQYVAFDSNNLMNIISYLDDTVNPPTDETAKAYYRWYICSTNFEAYVYPTLAWVQGNGAPQNPSCVKASIKRVFT